MMKQKQKPKIATEVVGEIALLKSLNKKELETLLTLGQEMKFEAHTNILIEGELSWGLYLILEGIVGIYKTNKMTSHSYDIGQLKAGSFFGEMSLIDDNPRSATVRAVTDCNLFYISKDDFLGLINKDKDLKLRFYSDAIRNLVSRLRELDDNYVISQYQLWQTALRKEIEKQ